MLASLYMFAFVFVSHISGYSVQFAVKCMFESTSLIKWMTYLLSSFMATVHVIVDWNLVRQQVVKMPPYFVLRLFKNRYDLKISLHLFFSCQNLDVWRLQNMGSKPVSSERCSNFDLWCSDKTSPPAYCQTSISFYGLRTNAVNLLKLHFQ